MDMPGITRTALVLLIAALPLSAIADEQKKPVQMTPIDRGIAPGDSCYGAMNERDEDLQTGNEQAIMQILDLMLNPGT
jgi:hypothetical protein